MYALRTFSPNPPTQRTTTPPLHLELQDSRFGKGTPASGPEADVKLAFHNLKHLQMRLPAVVELAPHHLYCVVPLGL